jgi:hypothetical protein
MRQNVKPTKSAIFIPVSVARNRVKAQEAVEKAGLSSSELSFLTTVLDMAQTRLQKGISELDDSIVITLTEISEMIKDLGERGSTRRVISNKCKRLTEAGFFKSVAGKPGENQGGRAPQYFILHPLHENDFEAADSKELRERAQGRRNYRAKTTQATLKFLRQSDAQLISHMRDIKPVTETIFTGLLDRAMRFTHKEKPENNRIHTKFKVKGTEVLVMATTATGPSSELALLADQRTIRALLSALVDWMDNEIEKYITLVNSPRQSSFFGEDDPPDIFTDHEIDESVILPDDEPNADIMTKAELRHSALERSATERISNSFVIDTVNIATRMGYVNPHSTSVRRIINQSLRRLYDTNFRLVIHGKNKEDIAKIMQLFGLEDVATDFRFLTELKSQYEMTFYDDLDAEEAKEHTGLQRALEAGSSNMEEDEEIVDPYNINELQRVRFWRLSLDNLLFQKLLNKKERKLFTAHKEIMKEQSGLGQSLYNLFTSTLGRRNQGENERPFSTTLRQLHNTLWATRRYNKFEEDFCALMQKYMSNGSWDDSMKLNTAHMFGYLFKLEEKSIERNGKTIRELELNVYRDKDDPLSGDNSYFNKRVAKEKTSLKSKRESSPGNPEQASPTAEELVSEIMSQSWFDELTKDLQAKLISKYPQLAARDQTVVKKHGLNNPYVRELFGLPV